MPPQIGVQAVEVRLQQNASELQESRFIVVYTFHL